MFWQVCSSAVIILTLGLGCASPRPVNPSFAITPDQAEQVLREMADQPRPLQRPVVIIGGLFDPNFSTALLRSRVHKISGDERIIPVVVGFKSSMDECRQAVIAAVDEAFPSADPEWTVEVDVIGASLGGLVGRYAAAPSHDPAQPRRLRVARLFTISSPHSGAVLARAISLNSMHSDMKPQSAFLKSLAAADGQAGYELYPYVLLNDRIVGEKHAAPPGQSPWWLAGRPFHGGHGGSWHDPRIFADIARRLRGETPFTTVPPEPLPED